MIKKFGNKKRASNSNYEALKNNLLQINSSEIISHLSKNSKIVYCLVGFEHSEIMQKLKVNHLIFYDKNSFTNILQAKEKGKLSDKYLIFLSSNGAEYIEFSKAIKLNGALCLGLYWFDIEVLKAIAYIQKEELNKNDCVIGLTVGGNGTFKALIDEVKRDFGFTDNIGLYAYIKEVLEIEEKRVIKGKK